MAVRYNRLLKLLIDRNMSTSELAEKAGVSANIVAKFKKGQYLSMETVEKLCHALNCGVDDILEFIPDNNI